MAPSAIAERYLLLALRLGKHIDGLVDGYYGPAHLQETVDQEDRVEPAALVDEARALSADVATSDDDPQRLRWLEGQLEGLLCVGEMVAGADTPWREAVRRCYGIDVEPVSEERFAAAHEALDAALEGDGDVATRLQAWHRSQEMSRDALPHAFRAMAAELRRRAAELVELPDGEHVSFVLVTDKPWSAYNWYLGNLRSRIEINLDLPKRSYDLARLTAHEVYPGHHTEHACKEALLVRRLARAECSILMIHTPECLVSEGIAQVGIERVLGDNWLERAAEIMRPFDVPFDAATARAVLDASENLDHVGVNVACLASERGWTTEEAVEYWSHWALAPEERARKSVEFATHPVWSIYTPTYAYGHRLVGAYCDRSADGFRRLLTEQLTTADLLEPAATV